MKLKSPLPNEHILSVFSRSYSLSALPDESYFFEGLGIAKFVPKPMFGVCLGTLSYCINTEQQSLLHDHSSYPLWLLSESSNEQLTAKILAGETANLRESILCFKRNWQFCSQCMEIDKACFGTSYWHNQHNLPGITHCYKHNIQLSKIKKVHSFKGLKVPHRVKADVILENAPNNPNLTEWSRFLVNVYEVIRKNFSAANSLRCEVFKSLDIPQLRAVDERPFFNHILAKMEACIPVSVLEHCFLFYKDKEYKRKPNLILTTLINDGFAIRNPVYWLVIMFWLKEELPTLTRQEDEASSTF